MNELVETIPTISSGSANPFEVGIPPEIIFFGEPRIPPPAEAYKDVKYHGNLLYWARHSTAALSTSQERIMNVFPKGKNHPDAGIFRLGSEGLSYAKIFDAWVAVMDDLEKAKAFIDSNIDLVPSQLFMRILTAEKLSAQSKNDLERMDYLKEVRRNFILAQDQLFFPLNIEIQKAETRVMTYLARSELQNFARTWDEVEISLHFSTLLAARLTWDSKVRDCLDDIKRKVEDCVGYMAEGLKKDLMSREFRQVGITSEVYLNATKSIEFEMNDVYAKILPEIKVIHETYFMETSEDINRYVIEKFCPNNNITPTELKYKLKIFEASLGSVQGVDYLGLRLKVQSLYRQLCDPTELKEADRWYLDYVDKGYDFETYEPDEVPNLVKSEQRLRDTGNAFINFAVGVMKQPTAYTDAFGGKRKKGKEVGNWLDRDPDWSDTPNPVSYEERMQFYREAYITQSELRKEAESRLTKMVKNRMDSQDKALYGFVSRDMDDRSAKYEADLERIMEKSESNIIEFDGDDEAS